MNERTNIIPRPLYLERIRPYIGKGLIKILTGQRRVGKSMILADLAREIKQSDPRANIILIDLEDFQNAHIADAQNLYDEISSKLSASSMNYIFIDEIQEVENFERVIRSLNLDPNNDVYVTGSNSKMLSSEIASRLAGRSVEIEIHPLSYTEFLEFHKMEDSDETLQLFLKYGGLPYLINLPNSDTWMEYLEGIKDAVVFRDVVSRNKIRNTDFLRRLILYMADNVGRIFTAKRISDYLKSQKSPVSVGVVQDYTEYIRQAFIVNRVPRWDIEGKRIFEIGEKVYFEDMGIRNAVAGLKPNDIAGLMENAVYNHLRICKYKIMVGILPHGKEIDFIAQKGGETHYVQVAVSVADEATRAREFGNLEGIPDNYRKTVVTLRESAPNSMGGIRMKSLREFLLDKEI